MDDQPTAFNQLPAEHKFNKRLLVVFGLVLIIVVSGVYFAINRSSDEPQQSNQKSSSVPEGWSEYKNSKYGIYFIHPKKWGDPAITEYQDKTGKHYDLAFKSTATKPNFYVTGFFGSEDQSGTECKGKCEITPFTKETIQADLSKDKSKYIKYGDNYYAVLTADSASGIAGALNYFRVINLSKVGSSALLVTYTLNGKTSCPTDKLAQSPNPDCIDESEYSDVEQFAKSVKDL